MNKVLSVIGGGTVVALLLVLNTSVLSSTDARPKPFESRPKQFSVTASNIVR